jgi:excisionase family DNA binding protein
VIGRYALVEEVADLLRVPTAEVVALVDRGDLRAIELPLGRLRVDTTSLKRYLRSIEREVGRRYFDPVE